MIKEAIDRIEKNIDIQDLAIKLHAPAAATYVVVSPDLSYKVISRDRFAFNSKYSLMDFYSCLISVNKPVDRKKKILSNNYFTFFFKDTDALTEEIIDNYYVSAGLPSEMAHIKHWISDNIGRIEMLNGTQQIKIFFLADVADYKKQWDEYMARTMLSSARDTADGKQGAGCFLSVSPKKPYLMNLSRSKPDPHLVHVEEAIREHCFSMALKSLYRKGFNILYIMDNGQIFPTGPGKDMPGSFVNGIIFTYDVDDKNSLRILYYDHIPRYSQFL